MKHRHRRATLLINPAARGAHTFDTTGALARMRKADVTPRLAISRDSAHAAAIASESVADGDDLFFVVGGDGSARAIAGVLAGSKTALATLRAGTANVWAHEMGIPSGLAGIDTHLAGQVVQIDLGYCNDEPFLLMAGVGWDAEISSHVGAKAKRLLGPGAYAIATAQAARGLHPVEMALEVDGARHTAKAAQVILGNTRLYGSVARLTPDAVATDGLLDFVVVSPSSLPGGVAAAMRLAVPRFKEGAGLWRGRATTFAIETRGLPIQLDGDVCGHTPARFRVEPGALRVSVPEGRLPPVLGG